MISAVNFTGREEMLTKGVKATKGYGREVLDRYVNEATIFSKEEQLMAQRRMERAKVVPDEVQRHEFLSQTELVGKSSPAPEARFVSDSAPLGTMIDIQA